MFRVDLSASDLAEADALVATLAEQYQSVENPAFVREATVLAHELPRALRAGLLEFRLTEPHPLCVVGGYVIDNDRIGPTPAHWKDCGGEGRPTLAEDLFFYLCASLLGDPIAWSTQQDGRLLHDVFPIKEHQYEQLGSGSEELLTWHIEDAFHPMRTDYVGLMCLRNPDGVNTTYGSLEGIDLPADVVEVLRQDRFPIRPDRSHLAANRQNDDGDEQLRRLRDRSYEWISGLDANPEPIAVLFGPQEDPYLRLDPYFMEVPASDPEAAAALDTIVKAIDANIAGYALKPGEVLFLDNYRGTHGREPFTARFDGTDRWLTRLNIARDLRKSRAHRRTANDRTIY
ncbi:arginine beta-hydroxylase, Fe(II)/alpha-ketoglutarate-dependent [Lentzea waywayandensis]|uniref:Arginine beta-hydroxylase, Fe(II)/alpha-ketoglutarate-dependent n=1 Tax=Lentzea waywayandensis TaxID=84724 RepID=A0A1I6DA73_9PSEU|nr:guanitoxin biosynthesis L-enduracididine beta-hydroxylase GntD [Lentzea waywayandensis]SFR02257.1 arginine beta-hydroxylase, Fe(II)/alpha-ketoglutarate-dependent [Lentzea waywayandensis]